MYGVLDRPKYWIAYYDLTYQMSYNILPVRIVMKFDVIPIFRIYMHKMSYNDGEVLCG